MRAAIAAICSGVLPRPEHDLREALADRAMVIDAGEAEVLVGLFAERGQQPRLCVGDRQRDLRRPRSECPAARPASCPYPSVSLTFNRSIA